MTDPDEARVERWRWALRQGWDGPNPKTLGWMAETDHVMAAIALADAEAVERVAGTDLWAEWERLRDAYQSAGNRVWTSNKKTERELSEAYMTARSSLDAFVRGLMGRIT